MSEFHFDIERYTELKFNQLYLLFNKVFKVNFNYSTLKKTFGAVYTGKIATGYMAYHGDRLAAYYGVFPYLITYKNTIYEVAQSGATMTDPDYQGKGLFTKLAKLSYETAQQEGSNLVFGFPNKNSYPGFVNKLNWKHDEDLVVFKFNISTFPLLKIATRLPLLKKAYLLWAKLFLPANITNEILENSLVNNEYGGVVHNENYFRLKKSDDKFLIKILSKKVWLKLDGAMWIGDMEHCTETEFNNILSSLKRMAFFTGCSQIVYITSKDTHLYNQYCRVAPPQKHYPIGYLNFTNKIPINKIRFSGSDFDTW